LGTGEAFYDWLTTDSWSDYRQRRDLRRLDSEVETLSDSLSQQSAEARRLRSQLAQAQGSLEERVSRLARSFDAFVELSDIRAVLAMFDAPALVRHRARQVIAGFADSEPDTRGTIADINGGVTDVDVPDYWLVPAVLALVALVRGEVATPWLDAANKRDPLRTAVFLAIGLVVPGRSELVGPWLEQALPPMTAAAAVTRAQRALWASAANRRFGPPGEELIRRRLADLCMSAGEERDDAWARRLDGLARSPVLLPRVVQGNAEVERCLRAGSELSAMARLCAEASNPAVDGGADASDRDELADVLRALVDEGTTDEAPLLRRVAELRAVIESNSSMPLAAGWNAPAGDPFNLLLADAFDGHDRRLRLLALGTGARHLLAAGERLAREANVEPPDEVGVRLGNATVRIRPTGAAAEDLAMAHGEIDRRYPIGRVPSRLTLVLGALGALLLLGVFARPAVLAVLTVLAGAALLVVGAVRWQRERRQAAEQAYHRSSETQHADKVAAQTAAALIDLHEQVAAVREQATHDLDTIRAFTTDRTLGAGIDSL